MTVVLGTKAPYSAYTDPKLFNWGRHPHAQAGAYSVNTSVMIGTNPFNLLMSHRGSVVNNYPATTNYTTVVNVTGSGFLGSIWLPRCSSNNAATWTVEITIDGVITERVSPSGIGGWNTNRITLGAPDYYGPGGYYDAIKGYGLANNANPAAAGYFNNDSGNLNVPSRSSGAQTLYIPVEQMLMRGQPVMKFETDMKVRYKCTIAPINDSTSFAGALYIVNP